MPRGGRGGRGRGGRGGGGSKGPDFLAFLTVIIAALCGFLHLLHKRRNRIAKEKMPDEIRKAYDLLCVRYSSDVDYTESFDNIKSSYEKKLATLKLDIDNKSTIYDIIENAYSETKNEVGAISKEDLLSNSRDSKKRCYRHILEYQKTLLEKVNNNEKSREWLKAKKEDNPFCSQSELLNLHALDDEIKKSKNEKEKLEKAFDTIRKWCFAKPSHSEIPSE